LGTVRLAGRGEDSGDGLSDVRHLLGWHTLYMSNSGQKVTGRDAADLASALEKAAAEGDTILHDWSDGRLRPPADIRSNARGFGWFNTLDGKDHLQHIAAFCRRGEFQIF
jgi:hypothetical protein